MSLIVAREVHKSYATGEVEVHALRGVSFDVEAGSFIAFVGPSGSGKTTLLNLIGCLDKPSAGRLEVVGVDVTRLTRQQAAAFRGEHLGFVFQSFNLIPVLTAFENVEYPLVMVQNRPASARRERVLELLDAVGITDQRDKLPEELSGGQNRGGLMTVPTWQEWEDDGDGDQDDDNPLQHLHTSGGSLIGHFFINALKRLQFP